MSTYRLDVPVLHRHLDQRRRLNGLSWRAVARETGIASSTFNRIANGQGIDADALLTLLRWLGRDQALAVFTMPGAGPADCPGCGWAFQVKRDGAIRKHPCKGAHADEEQAT